MTVISQADELKAYEAAQTPKEMVESWSLIQGGKANAFHKLYEVYEEKAPHLDIIKTFVHQPEIDMMERGILDPKAKELAKLTLALGSANTTRITSQVVATKARGATDEEIMDTVWLAAYSARKNAVTKCGLALQEGWKMAEEMKTWEKYQAARTAGNEFLIDPAEETNAFRSAKTQGEMVASWNMKLGLSMEDGLREWNKEGGPLEPLKVWDTKAPNLDIIKNLWHDPEAQWMERCLAGHSVNWKAQSYIWWIKIAQDLNPGGLTFHVACLLCRGVSQEEIMELFYLLSVEVGKDFLEKAGPALAEGFRQAVELGL